VRTSCYGSLVEHGASCTCGSSRFIKISCKDCITDFISTSESVVTLVWPVIPVVPGGMYSIVPLIFVTESEFSELVLTWILSEKSFGNKPHF